MSLTTVFRTTFLRKKDCVHSQKMNFCATYFIRINVFVGANKLVLVDCYVQLLFTSLAEKKNILTHPSSYVRAVRKKKNECTSLSLG
jgi:hypothetical protein